MAVLDGEWTRSTLREFVDAWHQNDGTTEMARREHKLIGLMVYGLTAHTHALAKAVLTLDSADAPAGVVPLVRQALECATTAVWLELAGFPAVLTVLREQSRQQRNLIDAFVKSGQVLDESASASIDAELAASLRSTTTAGAKIEQRCKEISGGTQIYALYRALSSTSHAGASVVDLYLASNRVDESTNPDDIALRLDPEAGDRDRALGMLLAMLIAASSAWCRLDRRHYMRSRLKALCQEMQVAYKHELTAEGLAQKRKRDLEYRDWSKNARQ